MAEPSLLCVNCASPPPPHRRTWGRCTVCAERNLPSTYYCGEECMNAHWHNGHQEYHKEQKERAKEIREGTVLDADRSALEAAAWYAERMGSEYDKRFAAALALGAEGDLHGEAKAWRKIIKQWPEAPTPYYNLAVTLDRSDRNAEAAQMHLKAMELHENGTKDWAAAAAAAFDLLKHPDCREVPTPEWWNDEALKALSARVVASAPDEAQACSMRARVLSGNALSGKAPWNAGPRTATEIKEAATWYRRAAMVALTPVDKLRFEGLASDCDAVADPLLVEAEAEAAEARAAAKVEEAEALKVAEAKALAAAEELLAEEEEEKQRLGPTTATQAGKTKGKAKKGKGKR